MVAEGWYESHRNKQGSVNTNVMTSGIAIAELLSDFFPLTAESIRSAKKSQVKGLSGSLIKRVLEKYGETRKFTSEGGRTSRGTLEIATKLAIALTKALTPFELDKEGRETVASALQSYFVERIEWDYFNKKRLELSVDLNKPVAGIVADILNAAKSRADQPTGAVAQHLVGAKLELRFPDSDIGRDKTNTADMQTSRQGDFQIGNTAFHVTMAPSAKLADRAEANISQGFRPLMLVPETEVAFAVGLFKSEGLSERVGVQSIESFVGINIEEMCSFSSENIQLGVAKLIRQYNDRIEDCESDQSLRIEEPAWITSMLDSNASYGVTRIQAIPDEA